MNWQKSLIKKMEPFGLKPKVSCRSTSGKILNRPQLTLFLKGAVIRPQSIKTNVNLVNYTSFKIGGAAEFFLTPKNIKELQDALGFAKNKKIPVFILGSGSNILISDNGVKGLVIKLNKKCFKNLYSKGTRLVAGSGLKLNQLILFAKTKGLSGLEFLAGIPGTLGGSLIGNAGAWGKSIGDLVEQVCVLDYNGRQRLLSARELRFSYRRSNLNKCIILWSRLKLEKKNKAIIAAEMKRYFLVRSKTQNNTLPNAGCIFKNPSDQMSAGKLIDLCKLKGRKKGKAIISKVHANFILNLGNAKSSDVLFLINLICKKVKSKFGINLAQEIKLWQ